MKLISTEHGQAFQRFLEEEIRPPSGIYMPDLLRGIAERYGFATLPSLQDALKEGAKFSQGRFFYNDRTIAIKELGVFSDGALIQTWNTEDANIVMDDLISWSQKTLGMRPPLTVRERRFTSSVVVEFDGSSHLSLEIFRELKDALSKAFHDIYGWSLDVKESRLALSCDPTTLPPLTTAEFTVERRRGIPFSQNRYFSVATLPIQSHLELLESFERCLLRGRS
jgi:hypothetical protein